MGNKYFIMKTSTDIIEKVSALSLEEMEEVESVLKKIIIERRREEILKNHEEALKDYKEGKLFSSNNADELVKLLNNL